MEKLVLLIGALMGQVVAAAPQVKNVKAMQQCPWGKMYVTYEVVGDIAANTRSGETPFLFVPAKTCTGEMG